MKHVALLLAVSLLLVGRTFCAANEPPPAQPRQALATIGRLPGVDLAEGIAQLTGVAISPLLGVSAVGAWQYCQAPAAERAALPWFCRPWIWGTGFVLLTLCFLKDLIGAAAPPLLKKPLDFIELFENKISGFVACSAFLPVIVSQVAQHAAWSADAGGGSQTGWLFDQRFVTMPLAVLGFAVVWLACHGINVLIALCPFGFVDALLKLFKVGLLSTVVASSFVSPFLGAAVSLAIVFVAALVAPRAFRLTVFGMLFGLDVLLPARGRRRLRPAEPHAFLARAVAGAPVRTYGRLMPAAGGALSFSYRPWLILPRRAVSMPPGKAAIAKGLLFPSLVQSTDGRPAAIMAMFLPRYRSHEHAIAMHFGIGEVRETPLARGFRAVQEWWRATVSLRKPKAPK